MFNPQATSEGSTRSLHFQRALGAAFKARRQHMPDPPASFGALLEASKSGTAGLLARSGVRDALGETRARLFHAPGRDADVESLWHESLATATFAARVAQFRHASSGVAFCAGLLHLAGDALALKMLARVELDYRMKLESPSRREWCEEHAYELLERLARAWNLSPEAGSCVLGWKQFGEFDQICAESAALHVGRTFAAELLQPHMYVPGAVEEACRVCGLDADSIRSVRGESDAVRELLRALD